MNIHRSNHTRKPDDYTERNQMRHESTEGFKIGIQGEEITFEAIDGDYRWTVTLSSAETAMLKKELNPN